MLDNAIVLTDGTTPITYDLVSRKGMESKRVQNSGASLLAGQLDIANTVDLSSTSKKARHLLKISWREQDPVSGEIYEGSVHAVISRHPKLSDASIHKNCDRLGLLIGDQAKMADVLRGGN